MKKLNTFLGSRYSACELTEIDARILWAVRRFAEYRRAQVMSRKIFELGEKGNWLSTIIANKANRAEPDDFDIMTIRCSMKKLLLLLPLAVGLLFSQADTPPRHKQSEDGADIKLPNGKSQQEEILKADYQKTLQDAAELVKLAEQLQDDLIKEDRHVLSLASLKRTEDIQKLARKIQTRLSK